MKIMQSRLKQIIKEEMRIIKEDRFSDDWEKIKSTLQKKWRINDQQTVGAHEDPDVITAEILEDYRYEWEDLERIIDDAVEEYNKVNEDKININTDEVRQMHRDGIPFRHPRE